MDVDEPTSPKPNIEESSTVKDNLLGLEELSNTVQSDFVPHLDVFLIENDGVVVEGEEVLIRCNQVVTSLNVGENSVAVEPPTVSNDGNDTVSEEVERKVEVEEEMVKNGEEENFTELNVSQVAEEEHLAELNVSQVGEEEHLTELNVSQVGEEHFAELNDSQVGESVTVAKDDDEGDVAAGTETEEEIGEPIPVAGTETEAETGEPIPAAGPETKAETGEAIPAVGTESEEETDVVNDDQENESSKVAENGEDEDEAMEETGEDVGGESVAEFEESELIAAEDDDVADEKIADTEMEAEEELLTKSVKSNSGGKRKRGGKISKPSTRSPAPRKTIEEDVCFICFDGGDLVLCDRRNCPKAYHPSCVNRDEAFFQAKGRWNCGWHLCSICEKKAEYMCYTCPFSSCRACIKNAVILCVGEKEKKGFCETCMKTVMLIENKEQGNEGDVDFDDKSSWEYLFKDYWIDLKAKLNLSLAELTQAKNPWKGFELAGKQESPFTPSDVKDGGSGSDNPSENLEASRSRRRRAKKRLKSASREEDSSTAAVAVGSEGNSVPGNTEWASKELLEFVMHMKNGDKSVISQFDVQALLLEYIKANKLRDPRRKSQIMCDARLENLFGKARVGHFEMLKLLESHFLIKEDSQIDDVQGSVVDTEVSQLDDDETTETLTKGKDRKRKMRKKGEWRGPQSNRDDYAAIDIHNINLIYLRRKLVEDLLEDIERFHDKVVGTFVRIRILGTNQKLDIYRLVQVIGTSKAAEPYKLGKKTADIMLEILNLDKTEVISIDTISNQEFTEDECKRLRQSIKCGFINRLTVGDILTKAMDIQSAKVNDWLETEVVRLSHLRDRASENGRKKELRECVEKLQLLKTSEERARRLEEVPVIHSDPNMDPNNESEDDTDKEDKKQEVYKRSGSSSFNRRGKDPISPRSGDFSSKDSWSGTPRHSSQNREFSRNLSNKNFSTKVEDTTSFETHNENSWNQGRDQVIQQSNILNKSSSATDSEVSPTAFPAPVVEKMWHYKDPSGKVQGPFSMVQLRKWSNNGYFPVNLRIWRITEKDDDGILLTDALAGRFTSLEQRKEAQDGESHDIQNSHGNSTPSGQSVSRSWNTPSVEVPKPSNDGINDPANLPSPTPTQSSAGWTGGNEGLQSPTPDSAQLARSSISSSINASGNKEPNAIGSLGVSSSAPQDSFSNISGSSGPQSSEQGIIVGSQNSQSGQLVPAPDNNMAAHMVQSVSGQNPPHGWGNAPSQNLHPKPSMIVPGQTPPFNHWGAVPLMVQNPAGNFLPQASSTLPQPEPWGPLQVQVPVNQPNNMQQQPLPPAPPTVTWATMTANPNMGWVGSAPGNPNMNWGPTVQGPALPGNVNSTWVLPTGPVPGNVNPGWVAPPLGNPNQGWVAAPIQGPVVTGNGNLGWGTPTGNQGPTPGNTNPGWGAPAGDQGFINTNSGWGGAPTEYQGSNVQGVAPGNTNNQSWGSPAAGNQGMWGSEQQQQQQQHKGEGYSGQRGDNNGSQGGDSGYRGRRPWNRGRGRGGPRDSSRSSGSRVCPYYPSGRCNMGSSCKYLHN